MGKIHFAVAIVGAPMQMVMVDYGLSMPDAPLQAHMKCTLILSSVVHLSLGWFCVSNSVHCELDQANFISLMTSVMSYMVDEKIQKMAKW